MSESHMLGPFVRRFLLEEVVADRNLTINTQRSYRDSIRLLLRFMADHLGTEVSMLAAQISSNTELVYGSWDAEALSQDAGSPYDDAIDPTEIA